MSALHRYGRGLSVVVLLTACGNARAPNGGSAEPAAPAPGERPSEGAPTGWQGLPGERLGPLPAAASARTTRFVTSDACATCHAAGTSSALRDASGRDVSPASLWQGSMMALAARDPYYLAVLEHELDTHPSGRDTVLRTCTRCHAPAANVELAAAGAVLDFASLTSGTTSEAMVGRDGVTCTVCHQIRSDGLGTPASFTGGYVIGDDRRIFGPHEAPLTMPMQQQVGYVPTAAAHVTESGLCGSCHTVVTRALDATGSASGPAFLEQGPFVEWSVSDFAKAGGQSCQSCHVPTTDDDGAAISTVISTRPPNRLAPRSPIGRHTFAGANAMMLRVLAAERTWAGYAPAASELLAQADRADASLRSAARISLAAVSRDGGALAFRVRVENLTGHKLPTAYPSRRMWLYGRALLDATGVAKDDRLLPRGFDAGDPRAALARAVGVENDPDFGSTDDVEVRVASAPAKGRIEIALLYQTIRPAELELLAEHPGPAALRFLDMIGSNAMEPLVIARITADIP